MLQTHPIRSVFRLPPPPLWFVTNGDLTVGPVVTDFAFAGPGDAEVALHRVPLDDDRETIQAALAMIRAGDARTFDDALAGWRFPSANVVFGDREGAIGFRTIAAFPLRSPEAEA